MQHRILIVDDERRIADTSALILQGQGYQTDTAYNGASGIGRCREFHPQLVLTDVVMPGMSGIEMAIAIRREFPSCAILLISGQAATADMLETARRQGHTFELLAKPVHPTVLLRRVAQILKAGDNVAVMKYHPDSQLSTRRDTFMQSEYAEVNGVRLHYMTAGEGRLILFLHGFPEFWYAWKKQLAYFSRDHRAVAPDMRGYNLSSKPAEVAQYELKLLVEDVRALAERLGHKRFVLAGHDWGGVVAWAFAAAHPEYLDKLVIINAPHPAVFDRELRQNPAQQQASQYMLIFRTPAAEQILAAGNFANMEATVLKPGLQQGYFGPEDREAYLQAWSQPGAITGGLNYYRAAHAGPASGPEQRSEELAAQVKALRIEVPTLVIWGEKDPYLLTGNLNGLEQYVPDLTVRRVPDGSHWVIHEQPELINSYIREFIESGTAVARSA